MNWWLSFIATVLLSLTSMMLKVCSIEDQELNVDLDAILYIPSNMFTSSRRPEYRTIDVRLSIKVELCAYENYTTCFSVLSMDIENANKQVVWMRKDSKVMKISMDLGKQVYKAPVTSHRYIFINISNIIYTYTFNGNQSITDSYDTLFTNEPYILTRPHDKFHIYLSRDRAIYLITIDYECKPNHFGCDCDQICVTKLANQHCDRDGEVVCDADFYPRTQQVYVYDQMDNFTTVCNVNMKDIYIQTTNLCERHCNVSIAQSNMFYCNACGIKRCFMEGYVHTWPINVPTGTSDSGMCVPKKCNNGYAGYHRCNNHGNCTDTTEYNEETDGYYDCECDKFYDGPTCANQQQHNETTTATAIQSTTGKTLTQSTTNLSYTTTSTIQSTSTSIKSQLPDIPTDPNKTNTAEVFLVVLLLISTIAFIGMCGFFIYRYWFIGYQLRSGVLGPTITFTPLTYSANNDQSIDATTTATI